MRANVIKAIAVTYYLVTGKNPDNVLKAALVEELGKWPEDDVLHALNRCKNECKGFLPLAEIIERMPSKRLSPNEAWSKIPKSEHESVMWTDEMRDAYGAAHSLLLEGDTIAARVAFIEAYKRICGDRAHLPPRYSFSAGIDVNHRVSVIKEACDRKQITKALARRLLPTDKMSDQQLSNFEDVAPMLPGEVEQFNFAAFARSLPQDTAE